MTAFSFGGGSGMATASSSSTPHLSNNATYIGIGTVSNAASDGIVRTPSTPSSPTGIPIPSFSSLFPWISIYEELLSSSNWDNGTSNGRSSVESTVMGVNSLEGQKLLHFLRTTPMSAMVGGSSASSISSGGRANVRTLMEALGYPDASFSYDTPEEARLRESLRTHPFVVLHEKVTQVTPAIYQELLTLSNDLQLGLVPTIALYAHASTIHSSAVSPTSTETRTLQHLARELYFQERSYMVHCLKFLLYQRLATITNIPTTATMTTTYGFNPSAIIVATDELLHEHNLISSILQLIQLWTQRLLHITSRTVTTTTTTVTGGREGTPVESIEEYTYRQQRLFAIQQRQALAECLYLIAYQTQWTVSEVTQLLDYIHSFTDAYFDTLLDPFLDVPSIYTTAIPATTTMTATNTSFITTPIITTESALPKSKTTWDQEVIANAQNSGAIAMQSFLHTLILAALCAMDGSHTLWDRLTHAPNANTSTDTSTRITNTLYLQQQQQQQQQQTLGSIHQRLNDPSTEWKRNEIWGLFRTAYALLLLHTNTTNDSYMDSHTANPATPNNTYLQTPNIPYTRGRENLTAVSKVDDGIRNNAIDGVPSSLISSVTACNTLTWIRTSLLPSFRTSTATTTASSAKIISDYDDRLPVFFKSTLADFLSSYFYFAASLRELPTTRAQWTTDQESQMEYSRLQEEQRRQFSLFASSSSAAAVGQSYSISTIFQANAFTSPYSNQQQPPQQQPLSTFVEDFSVDYSSRPDCLDDLLACIVDVIFSCPACAKVFWDLTGPLPSNIYNNVMVPTSSVSMPQKEEINTSIRNTQFYVSFAVEEVQRVVILDPTITSGFLALLAALALADYAADANIDDEEDQLKEGEAALAIYQFLSSGKSTMASTTLSRSPSSDDELNWNKLFYSIEAYDMLLTPKANRSPSLTFAPKNPYNTSQDLDTDDHYYGSNKGDAYYSCVEADTAKTKATSAKLPKASGGTRGISEALLSAEDEECLKATLNLMTVVGSRCKLAHDYFMNLSHPSSHVNMYSSGLQQRPLSSGDKNVPSIISLLFRLLSKPLNVATKGALFNLIATLVNPSAESVGLMTWELLEACQILPTKLMSGAGTIANWNTGGNVFSPDHTRYGYHLAGDSYNSTAYGILHDITCVECFMGTYPATEGFLHLIFSLVEKSGCPPDLGSQYRRAGASPYIEFITSFLLPRCIALSTDESTEHQPLAFATPEDLYRLISRALNVLQAIICRYPVPSSVTSVTLAGRNQSSASQTFSSKSTSNERRTPTPPLVVEKDFAPVDDDQINELRAHYELEATDATGPYLPSLALFKHRLKDADFIEALRDFHEDTYTRIPSYSSVMRYIDTPSSSRITDPYSYGKQTDASRPKSPGFTLLAEILGGASLLKLLLHVLVQDGNIAGLILLEEAQDSTKQTQSLYKSGYLPGYEAMKDFTLLQSRRGWTLDKRGRFDGKSSELDMARLSRQKLMEKNMLILTASLHPFYTNTKRSHCAVTFVYHDVLLWRLSSMELTLRIFCGAAIREAQFAKTIQGCGPNSLNMTSVLNFGSHFETRTISTIYRISFLLQQAAGASPYNRSLSTEPLPVLAASLGYFPRTSDCYKYPNIASLALALVTYCSKTLAPSSAFVGALCGKDRGLGASILNRSFALQIAGQGPSNLGHDRILLISGMLDLILSSLLDKDVPALAYTLLGFDSKSSLLQNLGDSVQNFFSAILQFLDGFDFTHSALSASLASKCYEILYVICNLKSKVSFLALEVLRRKEFWERHITRLFTVRVIRKDDESKSVFEFISSNWSLEEGNEKPRLLDHISIMHSCAFLLSGAALDIRCSPVNPENLESNHINQHILATTRRPVFQLMHILFRTTDSVVSRILRAMPLQQTRFHESFPVGPALKDTFDSVTSPTPGPMSFESNFRSIDLNQLKGKLNSYPNDVKVVAMNYARGWNHYALATTGTVHLASALDCLIAAFLSSHLIQIGKPDESSVTYDGFASGWDDMISLLNTILLRLSPSVSLPSGDVLTLATVDLNQDNVSSNWNLEPTSALPLSLAALRLLQLITNMSMNEQRLVDLVKSCFLMATAISCCTASSASYDRAGVLSCGLALILPAYQSRLDFLDAASFRSDLDFDCITRTFSDAATFLSYLSAINCKEITASSSKIDMKLDEISTAARAGLCVILDAFDVEINEGDVSFLSKVFSTSEGHKNLERLVDMLSFSRFEICWALTQIASCCGGANILLKAGVSTALLSGLASIKTYGPTEVDGEMIDELPFGLGVVATDPPVGIVEQLQLLTTLMSAQPMNINLVSDVGGFMQLFLTIFLHLLSTFPRNGTVTEAFLICFATMSSSLCSDEHTSISKPGEAVLLRKFDSNRVPGLAFAPSISCILGNASNRLERSMIDFALHIASNPFPEIYLPKLSTKLSDLEIAQRMKLRLSKDDVGKSWWDRLNSTGLILPDPPVRGNLELFQLGSHAPRREWRSDDYTASIIAAKSLEAALTFLCNITIASKSVTLSVNPVFLGKALCRCILLSRAISDYLIAKKSDNENESLERNDMEREALNILGPFLGRASERLLLLALMKVQFLSRVVASAEASERRLVDTRESVDQYCIVLSEVLDYTQVERLGVGCVGDEISQDYTERSFSQNTARVLQDLLSSLSNG